MGIALEDVGRNVFAAFVDFGFAASGFDLVVSRTPSVAVTATSSDVNRPMANLAVPRVQRRPLAAAPPHR